ncbi:hypothetical protein HQ590_04700 [bacterium]|nr:hypothetical protein [bacterium]
MTMTLELLYKPDWVETQERHLAWWRHEYFGRCALAVRAPKDNPPAVPEPPLHTSIRQKWYDLEHIDRWNQYTMGRTFFGGEALPIWSPGYPGNNSIPVLLGNEHELDEHTGWTKGDPVLAHRTDFRALCINKQHPEYLWTLEMLRFAAERSRGKCLVSIGAFGGCGDTLAGLRTTNQLLYDVVDRPDWVHDAELYLMDMWCAHYEDLYQHVRAADDGSTCWFPLWSPGKFYATQNDFSYMISPQTFRELFVPALRRQLEYLDHAVYHVDGIGAFGHVDALGELDRLQAIQILPGAGKPGPLHYPDVLKRVQRAGKNLHIAIPAEEVRPALAMLSARGLLIDTWCETEAEARDLLRNVETWSVDRG